MLPEDRTALEHQLARLIRDDRELGSSTVTHFQRPPTALEFAQLTGNNRPAVFENVAAGWPALTKWRCRKHLESALAGHTVTVAVTPNGLADAPVEGHFVLPHEDTMTVGELLNHFQEPDSDANVHEWKSGETCPGGPAYYVQSQNNNMHEEFAVLLEDVPHDIDFASAALGRKPDAVNFWLGNGKSVTSLHKDHYENLYLVVAGQKTFTLLPPSSSGFLYDQSFPLAKYVPHGDPNGANTSWGICPLDPAQNTPWSPIDPLRPDPVRHPLYTKYCQPLTVTLQAGQILYLPSLWHHHVQQTSEKLDGFTAAVAVNFWYDMDYSSRYAHACLVRRLGMLLVHGQVEDDDNDNDDDGDV
ncbi:jmjC domain-containing protein 7 [Phlyctochytrium arcticum]|nr:jmjC domain-containing protein 7 [Phlyctochytrium arcticum]